MMEKYEPSFRMRVEEIRMSRGVSYDSEFEKKRNFLYCSWNTKDEEWERAVIAQLLKYSGLHLHRKI